MSDIFTVKDQLAATTAQLDQVQSDINNARFFAMNDQAYQLELDRMQADLDAKRHRISVIRDIANLVEN